MDEYDLPFPVLVDEGAQVIRRYGIFHENESKGREIARPSTFVLDPDGEVVYRYVGARASDRPKLPDVLEAVEEAGEGQGQG